MAINSIDVAKLRNAEFIQFSNDILSIVSLNGPAALNVAAQHTAFQTATATIENLFNTDRANPLTTTLEDLDQRRDNAITGITLFVQSLVLHFAPATAASAKTLTDHLATFSSGIARESYQSETAIISAILNDWAAQPLLAGAVAVLGLGSWITELDTANKAFNSQYLARTQQMAAASPDTLKAKRLEAANAYYKLRDRINAFFIINEEAAPFSTAVNELNALIDQYNNLVAGRGGSATPAVPPVVPKA